MPLGNLTSQFFANVYLNELDQFVKHKLKAKYYIRYVDDFVILHNDSTILEVYKNKINKFLKEELKLELHHDKSKVFSLANGTTFLGYRIFYHYKLLRKSNLRKFQGNLERKIRLYELGMKSYDSLWSSLEGWSGYAIWADTYKLRKNIGRSLRKLEKKQPGFN